MDAALARAARVFVCGNFLFAWQTTALNPGARWCDCLAWIGFAGLGDWSPEKERCPGGDGSVCVHTQSPLPRQLSDRGWIYDCLRQDRFRICLRGIISGHLCSCNARRIGHTRGIVWRELSEILEGSAAIPAAVFPLSRPNERHGQIRRGTLQALSRVSGCNGIGNSLGPTRFEGLYFKQTLKTGVRSDI